MYKGFISIRSCSQTRPGICSQTRLEISLCSLSGLSLQGRGQFLVMFNQSEQDQESLSARALDCLCQTGLTPCSVSSHFHRTILLFLLLCKIMFPGPVGALRLHCQISKSQNIGSFSFNLWHTHNSPYFSIHGLCTSLVQMLQLITGLSALGTPPTKMQL